MLDWEKYIEIARRLRPHAKPQDKDDLNHDIIISLAEAQRSLNSRQLNTRDLFRIASYQRQKYWRRIKRFGQIISLNSTVHDSDESKRQLIETLEDTTANDADAQITAEMQLSRYPKRIVQIGKKILLGQPLSNKEHQYLWRFRHRKPH